VAWGGRTAKEVAEIEGIPLGTAKTRIRAAMARLAVSLGPRSDAGLSVGPPPVEEIERSDGGGEPTEQGA